jgi:hypothetical protein
LPNLSALPAPAIEAVKAALAGQTLPAAADALQVSRSLPDGHVAAVRAKAKTLGFPALLGRASRDRFGLWTLAMVGDRGVITATRIDALREPGRPTCLRARRSPP